MVGGKTATAETADARVGRPRHGLGTARPRGRVFASCLVIALAAACTGKTDGATRSSQLTSPPMRSSSAPVVPAITASASGTPTGTADVAVLAAYAATYDDVTAAVRAHDSQSSLLSRHAVPPAEYELQSDVEQYLKLGVVPVGAPDLHARVTSLTAGGTSSAATVAACPDAPQLVDSSTGQPVSASPLPPNPFTVTLETVQGRWVVSEFKVDRSATCSG